MKIKNQVIKQLVTGLLLAVAATAATAARGGEADEGNLDWNHAILRQQFAPNLQFVAEYVDRAGSQHQLQYWRERQNRLRRTTDGKTDLMAERASDGTTQYTLIDHQKKVLTQIKQDNLYRIGNFTSWDDLVHILSKPAGNYTLRSLARAPGTFAGHRCSWMQLSAEDGAERDVCWSSALGIPLQITQGSAAPATLWRVISVSTRRPPQSAWTVDVNGYVRVNADDDIDPSSD